MAAPVDALTSFTYLSDNIPDWLTKLDALAAQVTEQHSRFTRLTQFSDIKLTRKKHDSTESLRPKDRDDDLGGEDAPIPPKPLELSSPRPDNSIGIKDIGRKRKSVSTVSDASGPQRYRTRSMLIVYYDSAIQEAFESLVRMIASGRNNLRKGKTAASFKVRMASLGMVDGPFAGDFSMLSPKKILSKPNRQESNPPLFPAFDDADKDLEAAQSLCEVAAHQFLRDGDCNEEILRAKERFTSCLKLAQQEMEKIKEQQLAEPAEDESTDTQTNSIESEHDVRPSEKPVSYTGVGVIEVDNESDGSSVHIDLEAFRRNRRR